jgi:hypothetical protein
VINRSKKQLEFGNRSVENATKELESKRDFELPKKEKDLQLALTKAENGLREAKAEQTKWNEEKELKLRKSDQSMEDLEKEIKKMKDEMDAGKTEKAAGEPPSPSGRA